ncbi:MAG: NAD(P)H-dependent glycerol-3-phosphate dehydrogenase [Thermoanaerobaculia bacterium]
MSDIGVLGAGSWGTSLAVHLARRGARVRLWTRRGDDAQTLRRERMNRRYLPNVPFPEGLEVSAELADMAGCDPVLVVVPSHGFRQVLQHYLRALPPGASRTVVSATKGIEMDSLARMSQVTFEEALAAEREVDYAVLSGPTFADELARGVPTAAVVASEEEPVARRLREQLAGPELRLYSSPDVTGVELGGAAKNVVAIAAGVVSGLASGHNTLAALITRGLHEITRLGVACGGQPRTFAGLAGLGDLVLTCTGPQSRNRQTGERLARGETLEQIQAGRTMVAEGIRNSLAMHRLAGQKGVEMPIVSQMVAVLYEGLDVRVAIQELMTRELKAEAEL